MAIDPNNKEALIASMKKAFEEYDKKIDKSLIFGDDGKSIKIPKPSQKLQDQIAIQTYIDKLMQKYNTQSAWGTPVKGVSRGPVNVGPVTGVGTSSAPFKVLKNRDIQSLTDPCIVVIEDATTSSSPHLKKIKHALTYRGTRKFHLYVRGIMKEEKKNWWAVGNKKLVPDDDFTNTGNSFEQLNHTYGAKFTHLYTMADFVVIQWKDREDEYVMRDLEQGISMFYEGHWRPAAKSYLK